MRKLTEAQKRDVAIIDEQMGDCLRRAAELAKRKLAIYDPSEEDRESMAEMLQEDGRDMGLFDSVGDLYWEVLMADEAQVTAECEEADNG